jgi:hypothetical protein
MVGKVAVKTIASSSVAVVVNRLTAPTADAAVRNTSIGSDVGGSDRMTSTTAGARDRCCARRAENSASSAAFGRCRFQSR